LTALTADDSGHMADVAVIRSAREISARAQPAAGPRPEDAPDGALPRPRVTVLGSLNMDICVTAALLPAPGMTVLGSAARFTPGGKGANQAVAAARLGADVRMVGCVGQDDFGRQLLAALRAEGVHTDGIRVAAGAPTGLAMITVDPSGENLITVAPGANYEVSTDDAAAARADGSNVLVISAEIPVPAIGAALVLAKDGAPGPPPCCILNLAPVPQDADMAAALASGSGGLDWLVVNEPEAAAVLGRPVDGLTEAERAAGNLAAAGARHAVVTAGGRGAALAGSSGETLTFPGFRVEAVDTVGAGDTFVGGLAVALAAGLPAAAAVRVAAAAGATAVTRHGAQTAMPRPADIAAATGLTWPVR
jgi:ribokinase